MKGIWDLAPSNQLLDVSVLEDDPHPQLHDAAAITVVVE